MRKGNVSLSATALSKRTQRTAIFSELISLGRLLNTSKMSACNWWTCPEAPVRFSWTPRKQFAGKQRVEEKGHSAFKGQAITFTVFHFKLYLITSEVLISTTDNFQHFHRQHNGEHYLRILFHDTTFLQSPKHSVWTKMEGCHSSKYSSKIWGVISTFVLFLNLFYPIQ